MSAPGGVSALGGGLRGVSATRGGICSRGAVSALGGSSGPEGVPACTEADPLPPVNRMNDRQV